MEVPTLSFGVELEGVLVFHESLLTPYLPPGKYVKKFYTEGEIRLRGKWPNSIRGWAIEDLKGNLHRYDEEPIKIASKLLQSADDFPCTANGKRMDLVKQESSTEADTKITDIKPKQTQWKIVRDVSVFALNREEKIEHLSDLKFYPRKEYDSSDLEFVSPVYVADGQITVMKDHVDELYRHLETRHTTIVTTESCGLHVHVGLPDNSRMPLQVLRVLAFMTVMYEDEITLIHDKHRLPSYIPIVSNRKHFKGGNLNHHDYSYVEDKVLVSTFLGVAEIRGKIFLDNHEDEDAAYEYLKDLLSDNKGYCINWNNINGKPVELGRALPDRPPTVEFRQHAATFDPDVIAHWVRFCVGLVRLAYKLADSGINCLPTILTWDSRIDLKDLLVQLDLPAATLEYFDMRLAAGRKEGREFKPLWQ